MANPVAEQLARVLKESPEGILCPECGQRNKDYVFNNVVGYVCRACDAAIRLIA